MQGLSSPLSEADVTTFICHLQAAATRLNGDARGTTVAVAELVDRDAILGALAVLCAAIKEQADLGQQNTQEPPLADVFTWLIRELCGVGPSAPARWRDEHGNHLVHPKTVRACDNRAGGTVHALQLYSMMPYRGFVDGV